MRPTPSSPPLCLIITILSFLSLLSSAERVVESNSLNPCQDNSSFTATKFSVVFTPDNGTLAFDIEGVSSISGYVTAHVDVIAYGYEALQQNINPCELGLLGMCPMNTGPIDNKFNIPISKDAVKQIPSIAYGVPDLDGLVRIYIRNNQTNENVACVEAELSNRKTVDQKGVGWATAVIAGLALVASAVTSGLGHSNTAAHVAANALSLFGYFQAQALIGMTAVLLPPVVMSWTQNFQWTMGIIRVEFLQDVCTWYQRATGGSPSTLLSNLSKTSVDVQKRSLDYVAKVARYAQQDLVQRSSDVGAVAATQTKPVIVHGIERVGFRARIESTNIFLTGIIFFMVFVTFTAAGVALFKAFCEGAVKAGWFKGDKFEDFRNGWKIVLKGILFRLILIGYPQMTVLCLWELTQRDSAAEVVLALFFFISMSFSLGWAALKVFRIAKRSVSMHKNPAYILYSDPTALNKWGFLYVQFRATAYYFIMPVLVYILLKGIFVAFGQGSGIAQAVGLVIIEAGFLIGVSILRPWMDKKTNAFNIAIAAVNFLNTIFLLVFTQVFNQPGIVTGVMGVVFFGMNAVFAIVLICLVLISTGWALFSKNPDTRYQPMRDDRGSFIKSQTQLNTELDALGATARGNMTQTDYKTRDLDDDEESFSSGSGRHGRTHGAAGVPLPPSTATSHRSPSRHREPPRSPIDPNMPLFPSDGTPRHGTPTGYTDSPNHNNRGMYNAYNESSRNLGYQHQQSPYGPPGSSQTNLGYNRQQNNGSPWQRGAGYDH
ncbi:MAG: hypothetical protein LQ339_003187 [Xanthoria mediterranea]|nr:MAG: hypothetical protein LQ339_003187 [Xanthoria mediterranea]